MLNACRFTLLLLPLLLLSQGVIAAEQNQPMSIEADQLQIDEIKGSSTYFGKVRLQQGDMQIQADQVELLFDSSNQLKSLKITGNPALFQQKSPQGQSLSGEAAQMLYHQQNRVLEMQGNAVLINNGNRIESQQISINTETQQLTAGTADSKERVRMIIQPQNNQNNRQQ